MGGGGGGERGRAVRILQSFVGGSVKFHRDTTKILPTSPSPSPALYALMMTGPQFNLDTSSGKFHKV